ncbi:MAG: thiamine phosphate synthase [Azospirillaceae bacterium]|nr:thiamine phosphate synthase [Azospirillaceae bacterium]
MVSLPQPPILAITDRRRCAVAMTDLALRLFDGGIKWLSLREKDLAASERLAILERLVVRAAPYGAVIMVHDDIEAAALLQLGLHLPGAGDPGIARQRLGPRALIGLSTHANDGAGTGMAADYRTVSPVFLSPGKPGYGPALGLNGLRARCQSTTTPVVALGGIDASRAAACRAAGAAGIAVISDLVTAPDITAAARRLVAAFQ